MDAPIVVGFDGTDESAAAALWAAREAERRGLPLELLQAWPWRGPHVLGTPDAQRWARQRLARQEVELRAGRSGVEVSAVHVPEDPVWALETAGRTAAMLVLGSRALGAVRGFVPGSVGLAVAGRAACPTVVVRTADPAGGGTAVDGPGPVVLAADLRPGAAPAVDFALECAALRSARLHAVRAWEPPTGAEYLGPVELAELEITERRRLTEALEPGCRLHPGVRVTAETVSGPRTRAVVEAADGAQLLVIGRRSRRLPVGPHLGAVAHAALHHAHCPVAVVPCD
ncbi:universal stress protein [Kitasatospora phosalacinea]|uniref:Universal stress protein n=1 Tax=Kitasatospora phosalacinea TaxID=2065 RepID=A0A9W6QDF5_9ACTN|nr:universal stress protein [Kitasatospora phosalacinea]GLW73421.1 universal stress protein [Kitasatospora phosalacinea]